MLNVVIVLMQYDKFSGRSLRDGDVRQLIDGFENNRKGGHISLLCHVTI